MSHTPKHHGMGDIIRYMSQVSYGISQICHIDLLQNFARQLAEFREPSASSLTIHRNIAGYLLNLRTYLWNDALKDCRGTFEGDCTAMYIHNRLWSVDGHYLGYEYASEYCMAGNFAGKTFWWIAEIMTFGRIYFGG